MKTTLLSILYLLIAVTTYAQSKDEKFRLQYEFANSVSLGGLEIDMVNGNPVISKWPLQAAQPNAAQIAALIAAYDARMATKQAAANTLYSTISTRLEITVTSKAELQAKLVDVWEALDTKEQAVWTAIESGGLNATRAGQLKQLAQARNKILRLLAEDGIQ